MLFPQMVSVGRVIAVPKASMRPRSALARGGSLAAPSESEYIPFAVTEEKTFCRIFSTRHLMMGIYFDRLPVAFTMDDLPYNCVIFFFYTHIVITCLSMRM